MKKASEERFVGIDVAKGKLDVYVHPIAASLTVSNGDGIEELIRFVKAHQPKRVVFESTGGYARKLHAALEAAQIKAYCVQPHRVRMYAEALGIKAKTDALDAKVIAKFAANAELVEKPELPPAVRGLRELVVRRLQIVKLRAKERIHKESIPEGLTAGWTEVQAALDTHIRELDDAIIAAVNGDADLRRRAEILTRMKGVGLVTCSSLLALLPELGQMKNKQAASLVGVAPFNDDSGQSQGDVPRHIRGGRQRLRCALFMSALSVVDEEGPLRDLYLRLTSAGKPPKVALTAVIRKLVVISNARIRDALFKPSDDDKTPPEPLRPWRPTKTRAPHRKKVKAKKRK
jgi:transposase